MKASELYGLLVDNLTNFEKTIPIISYLKNPSLRDRHWRELKEQINNLDFLSPDDPNFNFELLSRPELLANDSRIREVSKKADHEKDIEYGIRQIKYRWKVYDKEKEKNHRDDVPEITQPVIKLNIEET